MARLDGSVDSFEVFFDAEYARIVRLLFGQTGRWAVAEEIAQESFLAAHRNWTRVQGLDRPDLWLRRIALNRATSARRRLVAEIATLARLRRLEPRPALSEGQDVELWSEVRKLPRRQSAVVVLWAVERMTFNEIGEVLGCSAETARTHFRRAKERLVQTGKLRGAEGAER